MPALYKVRDTLVTLYNEKDGRPALEPVLLAGVSVLQFLEKVPDRQAVELVRLHLGWKYALELELNEQAFHSTSLVNFRQRLVQADQQRVVFDAVLSTLSIRLGSPSRMLAALCTN